MKGIEISFKNKKLSASISEGSLHVIIGQKIKKNGKYDNTIHFSGLDTNKGEIVDWYKSELSVGDKIIINIKDITKNSEPMAVRSIDNEKSNSLILEGKLRAYNSLKKELETLGAI